MYLVSNDAILIREFRRTPFSFIHSLFLILIIVCAIICFEAANGNSAIAIPSTSPRAVILTFDDGYESQYANAIPILDQYGFKATFYIVCYHTYQGGDIMTWQQVETLNRTGHDIEAHTMDHLYLDHLSASDLDYEIGDSKQCLKDRGFNPNNFASPYNSGEGNVTVINTVMKYYDFARIGGSKTMVLHCDEYKIVSSQIDCRTFFQNGTLTFANRYEIKAWSHNSIDISAYSIDDRFNQFVTEVNRASADDNGHMLQIPVLEYHRVDNSNEDSTTPVELFAREMKYLHDNNIMVLTMSDLGFDSNTNYLYIKSRPAQDDIPPFIVQPSDVAAVSQGQLTPVSLQQPYFGDNHDPISQIIISNNQSSSGYPLGVSTVVWKAVDTSGNSASVTQHIVITSNPDTRPPNISIISPSANEIISGPPGYVTVTVTGTSSDQDSAIKLVELETSRTPYQSAKPKAPGDWSTWTATVDFNKQGQDKIAVRATDLFNNKVWAEIPITISFGNNPSKSLAMQTVPDKPTGFTAIVTSPTSISLNWSPPQNTGGLPITGYEIDYKTGSNSYTNLATLGSVTTFTQTDLVAGTTYTYHISAINSIGAGQPSNEVSVTTKISNSNQPSAIIPEFPITYIIVLVTSFIAITTLGKFTKKGHGTNSW